MYCLPKSCLTVKFAAIRVGKETFLKELLKSSAVLFYSISQVLYLFVAAGKN